MARTSNDPVLGIDFGTSFSNAALLRNGQVNSLRDPLGAGYAMPSCVFLTDENELLVGKSAENNRMRDPGRFRREFKLVLGAEAPISLGDSSWSVVSLVAAILRAWKIEAETTAHEPVERAVLTIPATYESYRRELMRQAGEQAGFSEITLVEEPVAAAIYADEQHPMEHDEAITLVYDLGGGTFDATLIRHRSDGYELIGIPEGLSDCGGVHFDSAIYRDLQSYLAEETRALLKADSRNLVAGQTRLVTQDFCIEVKIRLSDPDPNPNHWFLMREPVQYQLSQDGFTAMIQPLLDETVSSCQRLLERAGIDPADVSRILLVGGSSRVPAVRTLLEKAFPCPVLRVADPELAVSKGAAMSGVVEPGEDIQQSLRITLESAVRGATQRVDVKQWLNCPECAGRGNSGSKACSACGGGGWDQETKQVDVAIPAGVGRGTRIRVEGAGKPGRSGGPAGDLYLIVEIDEHKKFELKGRDLHTAVDVPAHVASSGGTVDVQSLNGKFQLVIPPGSNDQKTFRKTGGGLPAHGDFKRGDLLVKIRVPVTEHAEESNVRSTHGGPQTPQNIKAQAPQERERTTDQQFQRRLTRAANRLRDNDFSVKFPTLPDHASFRVIAFTSYRVALSTLMVTALLLDARDISLDQVKGKAERCISIAKRKFPPQFSSCHVTMPVFMTHGPDAAIRLSDLLGKPTRVESSFMTLSESWVYPITVEIDNGRLFYSRQTPLWDSKIFLDHVKNKIPEWFET